jgi:hypothetical protein
MITNEYKTSFIRDGFFLMECQHSIRTLNKIRADIDRLHQVARVEVVKDDEGRRIEETNSRFFQWQVHTESEVIAGLLRHSCYADICREFVGRDADLFTGLAAVKVAVNGTAFPWHQDTAYAVTDPLESVTTWTAIDRATRENGCLIVIPGSHKQGLRPHTFDDISIATAVFSEDEIRSAVALEMMPGQIAVFSSLLLHMTGPNSSRNDRRAIVFQFHRPNVVLARSRKVVGDQHPVIRAGQPVNAAPVKGDTGVDKYL